MSQKVIKATENYAKKIIASADSGHDWFHIERVRTMARRIAKEEHVDVFLCDMIALLHDVTDWKIVGEEHVEAAYEKLEVFLIKQKITSEKITIIIDAIRNLSFSSHGTMKTLEGQIAQDADRLDALGAIGIARVMTYSGKTNRAIHDPKQKPKLRISKSQYKKYQGTAINHFYEKLLKLKSLMNTKTGTKIAGARHRYMEKYLHKFLEEWDGNA